MNSLSVFRKPDSPRTMGIEIECLLLGLEHRRYDVFDKHHGFFYATTDRSIESSLGNYGVEFVSQPLTKTWLIKEINKLSKKFSWASNHSCGIHIHVSRKWLNEVRAKAIHQFYGGLTTEQRKWFFGRDTNNYCLTGRVFGGSRYNAINNNNKDTVEFRMFSSGDAAWASYCVEMVCYLIHNAKHLNVDATQAFVDLHRPN